MKTEYQDKEGVTMSVIHVEDRTSETMFEGAHFAHWPDDEELPEVGTRLVIFDKEFSFTQHYVESIEGREVKVGPALRWLAK